MRLIFRESVACHLCVIYDVPFCSNEGVEGFYKGMVPNLVRVIPACCITFLVYENVSRLLLGEYHWTSNIHTHAHAHTHTQTHTWKHTLTQFKSRPVCLWTVCRHIQYGHFLEAKWHQMRAVIPGHKGTMSRTKPDMHQYVPNSTSHFPRKAVLMKVPRNRDETNISP